jgi:hypothetical protein
MGGDPDLTARLHLAQTYRFQRRCVRETPHPIPLRIILGRLHAIADDLHNPIPRGEGNGSIAALLHERHLLRHWQKRVDAVTPDAVVYHLAILLLDCRVGCDDDFDRLALMYGV